LTEVLGKEKYQCRNGETKGPRLCFVRPDRNRIDEIRKHRHHQTKRQTREDALVKDGAKNRKYGPRENASKY